MCVMIGAKVSARLCSSTSSGDDLSLVDRSSLCTSAVETARKVEKSDGTPAVGIGHSIWLLLAMGREWM